MDSKASPTRAPVRLPGRKVSTLLILNPGALLIDLVATSFLSLTIDW